MSQGFLKTQSSPLMQRIQFLEAKGLSPPEIDEVVRRSNAEATTPFQPQYGLPLGAQSRNWDWRDYFVRASICS